MSASAAVALVLAAPVVAVLGVWACEAWNRWEVRRTLCRTCGHPIPPGCKGWNVVSCPHGREGVGVPITRRRAGR